MTSSLLANRTGKFASHGNTCGALRSLRRRAVRLGLLMAPGVCFLMIPPSAEGHKIEARYGVYIRSYKNSDPEGWLIHGDAVHVHSRQKNWLCATGTHRVRGSG